VCLARGSQGGQRDISVFLSFGQCWFRPSWHNAPANALSRTNGPFPVHLFPLVSARTFFGQTHPSKTTRQVKGESCYGMVIYLQQCCCCRSTFLLSPFDLPNETTPHATATTTKRLIIYLLYINVAHYWDGDYRSTRQVRSHGSDRIGCSFPQCTVYYVKY
jgi:hypothetical protein